MPVSETRLGVNAPGLPAPTVLPPLSSAFSRRAALFGAVTAAGPNGAAYAPVAAGTAALRAKDARRPTAIAGELRAMDGRLTVLGAVHERAEDLPEWNGVVSRFTPLEEGADLPADTLAGVLAKARWAAQCHLGAVSAADRHKRIVGDVLALAERGGAAP